MATTIGPILKNLLSRSGLESLTSWATEMIIDGASEAEIEISLYDQPAFRQRFPMIFARANAGYGAISVQEVLEYENRAKEMAKSFGVSLSNTEISDLIANDVSFQEAQDRLSMAGQAVHMASTGLKSELQRMYGISQGDLIKYWLDPKKEAPVLQRRFAAASISEQATRSGWDHQLSTAQAEGLAKLGMEPDQAAKGFGALTQAEELFEAVDDTEEDIGVEDQLRVITGDQDMNALIEKRGEKRVAKFQEGGSFATGQTGVAGLGKANS